MSKTKLKTAGSYKTLEKKLDRIFSEYIRLKAAYEGGYCQCITCGKFYHWRELDNGHYISRTVKAVRFNEINCNPQCTWCNLRRQGQHHIYRDKLIEIYGKEEVEKLENLARIGGADNSDSLQIKIVEYRKKVKQLKNEKGL